MDQWSRKIPKHFPLHACLIVNALFILLIKWWTSVLFYKTFQKVASEVTNGASNILYNTTSSFWNIIFLKSLSFDTTLFLTIFFIFLHCILNAYTLYSKRVISEESKLKWQKRVIQTAANGSKLSNQAQSEGLTEQVTIALENISTLYNYQKGLKYELELRRYVQLWAAIICFIILPLVSGIFVLAQGLTLAFGFILQKYVISGLQESLEQSQLSLLSRCLDVSRNADVVAVGNKLEDELSSFEEKTGLIMPAHKQKSRYESLNEFVRSIMIAHMLPLALVLIYYNFEILSDDPIDLVFSVFVFLTVMDEIHKSIRIIATASNEIHEYKKAKQHLNEWRGKYIKNDKRQLKVIKLRYSSSSSSSSTSSCSSTSLDSSPVQRISGTGFGSTEGDIVVQNISLVYSSCGVDHQGLQKIIVMEGAYFTFEFQKSTALIGESGSGKSSLLKTIAGLIIPTTGKVLFGQVELKPSSLNYIRRNMSYCSQDSVLFARSIRENIWYENSGKADDKVIKTALKTVGLEDWLSMQSQGLDTKLSLAEKQVSGGQAQRLKLARLLCAENSSTVLLDEAFSALDSNNRNRILENLKVFLKNKTTICVTHHEDVIKVMDNIVEIRNRRRSFLLLDDDISEDVHLGSLYESAVPESTKSDVDLEQGSVETRSATIW